MATERDNIMVMGSVVGRFGPEAWRCKPEIQDNLRTPAGVWANG